MRIGSDASFISHSGTGSATSTSPAIGSTFTYTQPLNTIAGQGTSILSTFHYTMNQLSTGRKPALCSRLYSKTTLLMLQFANPGFQFFNALVEVTATGPSDSDTLCLSTSNGVIMCSHI